MIKKIKNPLSVLFGNYLQEERNKYGKTAEKIGDALDITASAYRMIESGNASFNTSKIMELLSIDTFQSVRFDKASKFLIGVHILEPKRSNLNEMLSAVRDLCVLDKEFSSIFYEGKFPLNDIFRSDESLDRFYSHPDVIRATGKFLTTVANLDTQKLLDEIVKIKSKSLCIFQPTMDLALSQYEEAIKDLDEKGNLDKKLTKLQADISLLSDVQLGYLYHNAVKWRNKHSFSSLVGILHQHENLANATLLQQFEDNLTQLWNPTFELLTYVIVSDDKRSNITKSINEFQKILNDVYYKRFPQGSKSAPFEEGYKKIKFYIAQPNSEVLSAMNLTDKSKELWLYEDDGKKFKYGFATGFIPKQDFDGKKNSEIHEYIILTTGETMFYYDLYPKLLNISTPI